MMRIITIIITTILIMNLIPYATCVTIVFHEQNKSIIWDRTGKHSTTIVEYANQITQMELALLQAKKRGLMLCAQYTRLMSVVGLFLPTDNLDETLDFKLL